MKFIVEIDSGGIDIHTKFHKYWFRHSQVAEGGY
jgi:hypothetical protein